MTSKTVLNLAHKFERQLLDGYREYLEDIADDRSRGHRAHYCEHGTDQWTDWDNICGGCEEGITMSDGLTRRTEALRLAHERVDDAMHAIRCYEDARRSLQKIGLSGRALASIINDRQAYALIGGCMESISGSEPSELLTRPIR